MIYSQGLTESEIKTFFTVMRLANNEQLFAMIEYMSQEIKARNEQQVIKLREIYINDKYDITKKI